MEGQKALSWLKRLERITEKLLAVTLYTEKIEILKATARFQKDFDPTSPIGQMFEKGGEKIQLAISAVFSIGQGQRVFQGIGESDHERISELFSNLVAVESFYQELGGIVGYHTKVLQLLEEAQKSAAKAQESAEYLEPIGYDLQIPKKPSHSFVRWGIDHLPEMAEMYPVGGAGDRLDLRDEKTNEPRPAAELPFAGRSLLASLIRDLQAKEYLYYKLYGKNLNTPIVLMTSLEKDNHKCMLDICEKNHWFGRSKDRFFIFTQPLVPVITEDGHWVMQNPCALSLKPGGHGVIWKLAKESKAFEWLFSLKRKKALLRQINNPIAGTDHGILAFTGIGCEKNKGFGFASCPRQLNTAQGMIVLRENSGADGYEYTVENIEYTDFAKKGLKDVPESPGSQYSKFPANTNILFVDIAQISEATVECPFPGLLVNFKSSATINGKKLKAGRLETLMQNISSQMVVRSISPLEKEKLLEAKVFVTYNERRKTISVTKNSYKRGKPLQDTPVGCFYEMMQNNVQLLLEHCNMSTPAFCDEKSYLRHGPNVLFLYHPALGPLYSIISQKIRGGHLAEGAEVQLEIAELDMENVEVEGSLIIEATNPLGHSQIGGELEYSEQSGKCILRNVRIQNQGISRKAHNVFWMNRIERKEKFHIRLEGNGEFVAENVTFKGDFNLTVPDGFRVTALDSGGTVEFQKEKIHAPTWGWRYAYQVDDSITLKKWIAE